jgi:protein arginine kinase activator
LKRKCDRCARQATHHSVEINHGQKIEKHLCDQHAADEGLAVKSAGSPINELLTNFVKVHSAEVVGGAPKDTACDVCGMLFSEFRKVTLLGCPDCYKAFESALMSVMERAHEGGTYHIGKVPRRAGAGNERQTHLMRMRKQLNEAVVGEDYELAARLRDDIHRFEGEG